MKILKKTGRFKLLFCFDWYLIKVDLFYRNETDHHKLISIKNGVDIKKTFISFKDDRSLSKQNSSYAFNNSPLIGCSFLLVNHSLVFSLSYLSRDMLWPYSLRKNMIMQQPAAWVSSESLCHTSPPFKLIAMIIRIEIS
jgi:hypothetical protein